MHHGFVYNIDIMQLKQRNSKKQGDVGMGVAIGYFASHGHTVCVPLTDSQDYDLVVDIDNKLQRIQVKTTTSLRMGKNIGYDVELRVRGGNRSGTGKSKSFDSTKADQLFILTSRGDQYLIPTSQVRGKTSITVGDKMYTEFIVSGSENIENPGELFS